MPASPSQKDFDALSDRVIKLEDFIRRHIGVTYGSIDTHSPHPTMVALDKEYTTSNVTSSRTLDATVATLAELRQVVGTLLEDLQLAGIIGGGD